MVIVGTELKININIAPIDGLRMSSYDFEIDFYIKPSCSITLVKKGATLSEGLHKVDEDNYIACIDSTSLGTGKLKAMITAYIPDSDFYDGHRTEKIKLDTNVIIEKNELLKNKY